MSNPNFYSRRSFLKGMTFAAFAAPGIAMFGNSVLAADAAAKKPLVAYFSISNNTKTVAEEIAKLSGGELLRIETKKAYPAKYNDLTDYAKKEIQAGDRPGLTNQIPNLDDYGLIYLGYPNWWSSILMPVVNFIELSKMNGHVIAPFCTHGGGGLGHTLDDLKKLCPQSKILKVLSISGSRAGSSSSEITRWYEALPKHG